MAQLYRHRADAENAFDELKKQWGWGGFTTRDLNRRRHMVRLIALLYDRWRRFARLADADHHQPAAAAARRGPPEPSTGGQARLTVTSNHVRRSSVVAALRRTSAFYRDSARTAEQLNDAGRWFLILAEALKKHLGGRQPWLTPPHLHVGKSYRQNQDTGINCRI